MSLYFGNGFNKIIILQLNFDGSVSSTQLLDIVSIFAGITLVNNHTFMISFEFYQLDTPMNLKFIKSMGITKISSINNNYSCLTLENLDNDSFSFISINDTLI